MCSRIISGKLLLDLSPLDLEKVIEAAVEATISAANAKNLSIHVERAVGSIEVSGDAVRLQQVVMNLLNNSVKFCDPGGRITVSTHIDGRRVLHDGRR